ncbi:winged helix-turn-helix domain-containing protein [Natranaeroarchaeum aerophilus]|uniref:Helix-turn-helix domain-containing protein n=1 Tax=Natranaeroarchaeum aerophilus TaxID=2917711 RepID=A0AAE3FNP6_9EURY|nr:helix-turn-helix domain-containing protein [Natranaeroarchaeum aerophilus]MCL9812573.1 helix-turn-helix domain-containing protein [Natranaeroarchaeum aerophilus]
MRRSGAWMTIWDDRILEILRDEDSGTPSKLAEREQIRVKRPQVSRRLQKLSERGLVKPLGNGVYIITERGEGYLDGEISTYEDEPDEIRENGGEENDDGVPSPGGI